MPAYLSKIAAAATGGGVDRAPILPTIRSRSPIAERDQRLTLTDTDWNFEDTFASESLTPDTQIPRESSVSLEPDGAKQPLENFSEDPSEERSQETSPVEILPDQPRQQPRTPDQTSRMSPVVASPRAEESMFERPSIDFSPVTGNVPPQPATPRTETTPPPRQSLIEPARKPGKSPMSPDQRKTRHPEHPQATAPTSIPPMETAQPESDSIAAKIAPQVHEREAPPRAFSEPGRLEQSPSPSLPPKTNRSRLNRLDLQTAEQRTEPARSGVIIDHLQVEVVPVPAEQPGPKPASSAPAKSAPISQIGPLRGTARHLAFSVRYR